MESGSHLLSTLDPLSIHIPPLRASSPRVQFVLVCVNISNNNLRNQFVTFAKLQKIFGCASYVGLFMNDPKTSENQFVGCGRYKGEHTISYWKETEHCYSIELEAQRVWDYAGENYVHRLIQSKTDGKSVELNRSCVHTNDGQGDCTGQDSTLLDSVVEYALLALNSLFTSHDPDFSLAL